MQARVTRFATGQAGRIFSASTNAFINTGDGFGMAARAGVHWKIWSSGNLDPTGVYGVGVLISEAVRGEGGYLLNKDGERSTGRYAPHAKDMASRDAASGALTLEIKEGRGCGRDADHLLLKLDHLGADVIKT